MLHPFIHCYYIEAIVQTEKQEIRQTHELTKELYRINGATNDYSALGELFSCTILVIATLDLLHWLYEIKLSHGILPCACLQPT